MVKMTDMKNTGPRQVAARLFRWLLFLVLLGVAVVLGSMMQPLTDLVVELITTPTFTPTITPTSTPTRLPIDSPKLAYRLSTPSNVQLVVDAVYGGGQVTWVGSSWMPTDPDEINNIRYELTAIYPDFSLGPFIAEADNSFVFANLNALRYKRVLVSVRAIGMIQIGTYQYEFRSDAVMSDDIDWVTPTKTMTPTPTSTPTDTHTPTLTPSSTPTATSTFTPSKTFTPEDTPTAAGTPTPTASSTPTATSTSTATYTPTLRKADFVGVYGDYGKLDFCVMANVLNVRNSPGGSVVGRLAKRTIFTVDLASKVKSGGYVWAEHDKGWSALYPIGDTEQITSLTHPKSCPAPTAVPTATSTRRSRATAAGRTNARPTAEHERYSKDTSYRRRIDVLIQGSADVFAGSLCGVISETRDCRKRALYTNVTNCVIRQAFFDSSTLDEAVDRAETFLGQSIPKMQLIEHFLNRGILDRDIDDMSPDEKALVDGLHEWDWCFFELEA